MALPRRPASTGAAVDVPAASFQIQLSTKGLEPVPNDGPDTWALQHMWETWTRLLGPGFGLWWFGKWARSKTPLSLCLQFFQKQLILNIYRNRQTVYSLREHITGLCTKLQNSVMLVWVSHFTVSRSLNYYAPPISSWSLPCLSQMGTPFFL